MIRAKLHLVGGEALLAACDSELFGKCLEDDSGFRISIKDFYDGGEVTEDEFGEMLAQATSANLVGAKTVNVAAKRKLVDPDKVKEVAGVPHALLFLM